MDSFGAGAVAPKVSSSVGADAKVVPESSADAKVESKVESFGAFAVPVVAAFGAVHLVLLKCL